MRNLFFAFMLFSVTANGQIIAFKSSEVKPYPERTEPENKQWYKMKEGTTVMTFNLNTIGVKSAIAKVKEILILNGLDFDNPSKDNSYLASYVENIDDYESLSLSCRSGGSIISKSWKKGDDGISILLDEKWNVIFHLSKKAEYNKVMS